ncbi:MAG TPA: hypothetical protein VLB12_00550 [Gemmatimonadales bacterium]|nr:hypothetical protein [Gemmatimonadales bacterium]
MRNLRFLPFLPVVFLAGCDSNQTGIACPAQFVSYEVVVTENGQPATDVSVTATLDRTGQPIVPSSQSTPSIGHYVIIDDGSKQLLRARPDTVTVTVSKPFVPLKIPYEFKFLGCNVIKVSGPDSVELH